MNQDIDIRTYFNAHAPRGDPGAPPPLVRTTNAVIRSGINTMDELLAKTPQEIARIRNAGEKCLELIYLMREKYAEETGKTPQGSIKEENSK